MARPYSVSFDRAVEYYDATRGFPPDVTPKIGEFLFQAGRFSPTDRVLEVGIGTGRIAMPIINHLQGMFGIDLSWGMMGKLREKSNAERVYLTQGNAEQLPFADASFDGVMITHVLHLVSQPEQVVREIRRVLKPNGKFLHSQGTVRQRMKGIIDAWESISKEVPKTSMHVFDQSQKFILQTGFTEIAEAAYPYIEYQSPQNFIDNVQKRLWSSTWEMPEEMIQRGIEAIKEAIQVHYAGDALTSVALDVDFKVRVYQASNE